MEFVDNRTRHTVLAFLVRAWQHLGIPEIVPFDHGREFCGWGKAARSPRRVIRFCLCLEVEALFIPEGQPGYNGSVEQFNGWFQPLLLERTYRRPADVRRQVTQLMTLPVAGRSMNSMSMPIWAGAPAQPIDEANYCASYPLTVACPKSNCPLRSERFLSSAGSSPTEPLRF
jgi:hypothetical protein